LRHAHRLEASVLQQAVDKVTAVIGWPGFVVVLALLVAGWVATNLAFAWLGGQSPDTLPSFALLETATSTGALLVACLILTTQRREDKLADHRGQLILELSISNDQKIAKIIALIEESRRDNPAISNRVDDQAAEMSTPSNASAVLEAIKELDIDG